MCIDRLEFRAGVRDTLPLMLGVFPFGLAYGIFGQSVGLGSRRDTAHVADGFCRGGPIHQPADVRSRIGIGDDHADSFSDKSAAPFDGGVPCTLYGKIAAVLIPGKWYVILACLAAVATGAWMEGVEPDEI